MKLIQGTCLILASSSSSLALLKDAFCPTAGSATRRVTPLFAASTPITTDTTHVVDGVVCRPVSLEVPVVGTVQILEATADSQEDLVDMALALEEDEIGGDQLLEAGDPYGAVLWPAAWAVAKYILENESSLETMDILELGTGTGLVSLALAVGGAKRVTATDYEPLALKLTQYAAQTFHSDVVLETKLLDMCNYEDALPKVDLVVAADIMYEPKTGVAMAHRAVEALKNGSRVIVGDSPGRPGRPAFLKALKELGISGAEFVDTIGRTCTGPRHDLICGKESTSVSDIPKDLSVAIMDLRPEHLAK